MQPLRHTPSYSRCGIWKSGKLVELARGGEAVLVGGFGLRSGSPCVLDSTARHASCATRRRERCSRRPTGRHERRKYMFQLRELRQDVFPHWLHTDWTSRSFDCHLIRTQRVSSRASLERDVQGYTILKEGRHALQLSFLPEKRWDFQKSIEKRGGNETALGAVALGARAAHARGALRRQAHAAYSRGTE